MEQGFTHRLNRAAGTMDSICHRCFATVATATVEDDLEAAEHRHTCDPEIKLRFDLLSEAAKLQVNLGH